MKFVKRTTAAAAFLIAGCAAVGVQAQNASETPNAAPAAEAAQASPRLQTVDQKLSYIVGANIAQQFQRDGIDLDVETLILAIEDLKAGQQSRLNENQINDVIAVMQQRVAEAQAATQQAEGEANRKEGEAFLKTNGAAEGVVTLENGLQYKVLKSGNGGPKPTASDTVTVHYKGTFIDGTEFDSSYARGEPATFPVSGVIPGWTQILQLMSVGDKWEIAIPSDLAYGANGAGDSIGPNAVLRFDVELLKIN